MLKNHQVCSRCVMDTTVPNIEFNREGVCSLCREADIKRAKVLINDDAEQSHLKKLVSDIKSSSTGNRYDCVIGVSGGVDSSYVAYLVKDLGLNPLAVHLDNGWNSELSVKNIQAILLKLDIDLYTHVINWNEFKDLQLSFLRASIANAEIPSDQAITAILYKIAHKFNLKYIINGGNVNSESIMPSEWMEDNLDTTLIKSVHKKFGSEKLTTYPMMGYFKLAYYTFVKRIKYVGILNYINFDKNHAMEFLKTTYGWKPYKGKHFESIFTRWFQAYLLPVKFGIDKRKAHFSSLIIASQMSKETAESILTSPPIDEIQSADDCDYIKEKFNLTDYDFENIIHAKRVNINSFKNDQKMLQRFQKFVAYARNKATVRD